jgi:hypothetical protein
VLLARRPRLNQPVLRLDGTIRESFAQQVVDIGGRPFAAADSPVFFGGRGLLIGTVIATHLSAANSRPQVPATGRWMWFTPGAAPQTLTLAAPDDGTDDDTNLPPELGLGFSGGGGLGGGLGFDVSRDPSTRGDLGDEDRPDDDQPEPIVKPEIEITTTSATVPEPALPVPVDGVVNEVESVTDDLPAGLIRSDSGFESETDDFPASVHNTDSAYGSEAGDTKPGDSAGPFGPPDRTDSGYRSLADSETTESLLGGELEERLNGYLTQFLDLQGRYIELLRGYPATTPGRQDMLKRANERIAGLIKVQEELTPDSVDQFARLLAELDRELQQPRPRVPRQISWPWGQTGVRQDSTTVSR